LPLGDSITYGYGSTDGNGYRLALRDLAEADGNAIDYIGSIQAGTMDDNYNDGYIGCIIEQIASQGVPGLEMVVLLLAGTNDINYQADLDNAPARLMSLVDEIYSYSPSATVIVSEIPLIVDNTLQPLVETYNSAVKSLVGTRIDEGERIVHVSLDALTDSGMSDNLHPNDDGYKILAQAFYEGVVTATSQGWIV
ncbi:carbohydrate esterase family 3 protein, partial [Cylindrobasidium torrendii FP15055 ss-10]